MLEEFGYTVIEASDGQEAVSKFMENKDRIDLLLSDIIMPGMNGREAYERIKKIKPKLKVLLQAVIRQTSRTKARYLRKAWILYQNLFPLITF